MKVFISWSGTQSHGVALALRDWLPSVIQAIDPYVSSEDIDKGTRWNTDISEELENSSFGVLCVTRENLEAPWVNFEAGALSKSLERSRVAPFLFGIQRSDVKGPLLQFQSTIFEKQDVLKLVRSLNNVVEDHPLEEQRLDSIFEVWWPSLEKALNEIGEETDTAVADPAPTRAPEDLLAEVLELVRAQYQLLGTPDEFLPPDYFGWALDRYEEERGVRIVHRQRDEVVSCVDELRRRWHRVEKSMATPLGTDEGGIKLLQALEELEGPIRWLIKEFASPGGRVVRRRQAMPRPSVADDE